MHTPSRGAGDAHVANRTDAALRMPEKAKKAGAPKCFQHMFCFALLEVEFIGRIVGIRIASNFDMSSDGGVTGQA